MLEQRGRVNRQCRVLRICLLLLLGLAPQFSAQQPAAPVSPAHAPPRVTAAERFLRARGWPAQDARPIAPTDGAAPTDGVRARLKARPLNTSPNNATWQPIGPASVTTANYGNVTGRVTSVALDPSDATGNSLYVGTTGGGVWHSTNAAAVDPTTVSFTPLTDNLSALSTALDASISVGAVTVQPGATGVILAGTGDPNDASDSYYGAGILRSADGGGTWSLSYQSSDFKTGLSPQNWNFLGEGIAGFAWSTVDPQLVVVAVSQSYQGANVNALLPGYSSEGLYYSLDAGVNWHFATITDGVNKNVQGPLFVMAGLDGNAATSVVWNSVRKLFIAAVRYHGYYQSTDGVTWTRMSAQPGAGLTTTACPSRVGAIGSHYCPIWRGTLAVNPSTGDTFAWTVDENLQDQGLWQDSCAISGGVCASPTISFATQINTAALEVNSLAGSRTVVNGDYNLALAAIPSQQDTLLLAGGNDLFKCNLAMGCVWRNTTNTRTCRAAAVAPYQHALEWNSANPIEVFVGNDSGLWRSSDAIGQTGAVCSSSDADHFQNLNMGLGSLAEVFTMAQATSTPNMIMAGLGVNGTAGVKGIAQPPAVWPQLLDGEGGPVVIDPGNAMKWYINNQPGVAIFSCAQIPSCTPASFGQTPVVTNADVNGDGDLMPTPAPFLVDPLDPNFLVIATCRVWRGPASGVGWGSQNAISPIFDQTSNPRCSGDALIRSLAMRPVQKIDTEVIYAGMYGRYNGGANIGGHIFRGTLDRVGGTTGAWTDLTLSPVVNDSKAFNGSAADVSSIVLDSHDLTGQTVYVTFETFQSPSSPYPTVYRSTDSGAHWSALSANLPHAPVNGLAIDPQSANIVYVALDTGVYYTTNIASCALAASQCWSPYGIGLPMAPVTELIASSAGSLGQVLTAGTYGRGIWQIPLSSTGVPLTTATLSPSSIPFADQAINSSSALKPMTLTNTGSAPLVPTLITVNGPFSEQDTCLNATIAPGKSCSIQIAFIPTQTGAQSGTVVVSSNIAGGQLISSLSGNAVAAGTISVLPLALTFSGQALNTVSPAQTVTLNNNGGGSVSIQSVVASSSFMIASNVCGSSLAAGSGCAIAVKFAPTAAGVVNGTLTMTDSAGVQVATLSGTGVLGPTDTLSTTRLTFPVTQINTASAPLTFTMTNSGDQPVPTISTSLNGDYQVNENCGSSLAGHASCIFSVVFRPIVLGADNSTLLVIDGLPKTQQVALYGTGATAPVISATHGSGLVYPVTQVNTTSPQLQNVWVQNTGGSVMATPQFQFTGQAGASFIAVAPGTCTAPLAANGGQCVQTFAFRPSLVGTNVATLNISSASPAVAPVQIPFSGVGLTPPVLLVAPTTMAFNSTPLGSTNTTVITVENVGAVAFTDLQWAITSNPANFAVTKTTCTPTLGPFSKQAFIFCSIWVTYTATSTQVASGTLTLSSASNVCLPVTVSLSGSGSPPAIIVPTPVELDFGAQTLNLASSAQTLTIFASGPASLTGLNLALGAGAFALQQNTCGSTLLGGRSCSVQVVFDPTVSGYQTALLTIGTSTPYVASSTVLLTGSGVVPATIQVLPPLLNFGSVLVNGSSSANSFKITNIGAVDLTGLSLLPSASFYLTQNTCPGTLAAGTSCTLAVVFKPTTAGLVTGSVVVSSTAVGSNVVSIPVSGYGSAAGYLGTSPSFVNFGVQYVSQSTVPTAVTISNIGASTLSGLTYQVSGNFAITSKTCGTSLLKGANCVVNIDFVPAAVGSLSGQLQVTSTTSGASPIYVALAGTGQSSAALVASVAQLSFPSTPMNATSSPMSVILRNSGIASVSGITIGVSGPFTSSTCSTVLAAGASCAVSVSFSPVQQGSMTGLMTIASTVVGVSPVTVALSGTASLPASLAVSTTSINFADTVLGATAPGQLVTISNPGSGPLNLLPLNVLGEPTDFLLAANTCASTLGAGASCTVSLTFSPTIAGGRVAQLNVASTTLGVIAASVQLNGTGVPPSTLSVTPSSLSFGSLRTGQISAAQTVTVSTIGAVSVSGINTSIDPGFTLSQNDCGGGFSSGGSCTLQIEFVPTTPGAYSGQLTLTAAGSPYPVSVSLTGTGSSAPSLQVLPAVLTFQTTGAGQISAPATVTITNAGTDAAVTNLTWSIFPVGASYQIVSTSCTATLAVASSCAVSVSFAPTASGPSQGWLVVNGDGVGSVTIPLQGTGLAFTLVANESSYTVASGQVAPFSFTVAIPSMHPLPPNPLRAVVSLECGPLPQNTICSFSQQCIPAVANTGCVTVTSSATGYVSLIIETGIKTASNHPAMDPRADRLRSALLVCGLILIPLALYRKRRLLISMALLAVLVGAGTSCTSARLTGSGGTGSGGGGGTPGGQTPGGGKSTPPGTYPILITATAEGATQQATIYLTVD